MKGTSETIGTLTFLREPADAESEWVEDCLIPKSYYSGPIPGGDGFVRGYQRYTIPVDRRKKKEGSKRTPGEIPNVELLRRMQLIREDKTWWDTN